MDGCGREPPRTSLSKRKREFFSKRYKQPFGSRREGHGFALQRRDKVRREYMKLLREPGGPEQSLGGASSSPGDDSRVYHNRRQKQITKAQIEREELKERKEQRQLEFNEKKAQRDEALKQYWEKKKRKHKKLCKKTCKGQPVMRHQIEYLLEKIEKSMQKTE